MSFIKVHAAGHPTSSLSEVSTCDRVGMRRNRWKSVLLIGFSLSAYVHAQSATTCQMSEVSPEVPAPVSCHHWPETPLPQLSDIRTATPWTYTDTIGYYNCVATHLTARPNYSSEDLFFTAVVRGNSFSARNQLVWPDGVNAATIDTTYLYITFPHLTVTNLRPGDAITLVRSSPATSGFADLKEWSQISGSTGGYRYLPQSLHSINRLEYSYRLTQ